MIEGITKRGLILVLAAASVAGCAEAESAAETDGDRSTIERLNCGSTKKGAKNALRTFTSVLRRGDEQEILGLLAPQPRFFALGASSQNGNISIGGGNRREAAKEVSEYGGLPIRIDEFMNAERPRRTTDFGFYATWNGNRSVVGKAALDCRQGTVIVFGAGVGGRAR